MFDSSLVQASSITCTVQYSAVHVRTISVFLLLLHSNQIPLICKALSIRMLLLIDVLLHFYSSNNTPSNRSDDGNSDEDSIEHMRRSRTVLFAALGLVMRARSSDFTYASLNAIFDLLHATADVALVLEHLVYFALCFLAYGISIYRMCCLRGLVCCRRASSCNSRGRCARVRVLAARRVRWRWRRWARRSSPESGVSSPASVCACCSSPTSPLHWSRSPRGSRAQRSSPSSPTARLTRSTRSCIKCLQYGCKLIKLFH